MCFYRYCVLQSILSELIYLKYFWRRMILDKIFHSLLQYKVSECVRKVSECVRK